MFLGNKQVDLINGREEVDLGQGVREVGSLWSV